MKGNNMKYNTIIVLMMFVAGLSAAETSESAHDALIKKMANKCPIAKTFVHNDADKNNQINAGELAVTYANGKKVNDEQKERLRNKAAQVIKHFDKNADSLLSKSEYVALFTKK